MICADVIFRTYKKNLTVVAVFPEIPTEITGKLCRAFSVENSFFEIDYRALVGTTRLSSSIIKAEADCIDFIKNKLNEYGYCLNEVRINSSKYTDIRKARINTELCIIDISAGI